MKAGGSGIRYSGLFIDGKADSALASQIKSADLTHHTFISGATGSGKSTSLALLMHALSGVRQPEASQEVLLERLKDDKHLFCCLGGADLTAPRLQRHMAVGLTGTRVVLRAAEQRLTGWRECGALGSFYPDDGGAPDYMASLADVLTSRPAGTFLFEWDAYGAPATELWGLIGQHLSELTALDGSGSGQLHVLLDITSPVMLAGELLPLVERWKVWPAVSLHLFANRLSDIPAWIVDLATDIAVCEGADVENVAALPGMAADSQDAMSVRLGFGQFNLLRRVEDAFDPPVLLVADWLDASEDHWSSPRPADRTTS